MKRLWATCAALLLLSGCASADTPPEATPQPEPTETVQPTKTPVEPNEIAWVIEEHREAWEYQALYAQACGLVWKNDRDSNDSAECYVQKLDAVDRAKDAFSELGTMTASGEVGTLLTGLKADLKYFEGTDLAAVCGTSLTPAETAECDEALNDAFTWNQIGKNIEEWKQYL